VPELDCRLVAKLRQARDAVAQVAADKRLRTAHPQLSLRQAAVLVRSL
jgi:hypothetical protein